MKEQITQLLAEFFPEISEQALIDVIASHAKIKEIPKGQIVMDYGSKIQFIPLLFEGKIKIFKEDEEGRELFLYYIHPGQGCAVSFSCFDKLSTVRAEALEDTKFIAIPMNLMEDLMQKYPSWDRFVLRVYNQRFDDLLDTLNELAFHKLDDRLLDYLEKQSFAINSKELNLTHAQIAVEMNTSREVISRLLKKLEKKGLVELARNKILIK